LFRNNVFFQDDSAQNSFGGRPPIEPTGVLTAHTVAPYLNLGKWTWEVKTRGREEQERGRRE